MKVAWDEHKRQRSLVERGLDFADAKKVLLGDQYTFRDDRREYGELRYITAGYLEGRFVVVTWTPRHGGPRIISMRHGHDQEEERYREQMGRSG